MLPSVGILNEEGKLVAWAYVGIDGGFITLYVLPEYRGKGLATYVAVEALGSLDRGEFVDLGFDGSSGWVHGAFNTGVLGEKTLNTAAAEMEASSEVPHNEELFGEGILFTGVDGGFGRTILKLERAFEREFERALW
jgi:hypothetical protein